MPQNVLGTARVQVDFRPKAEKTEEELSCNPEGNLPLTREVSLQVTEVEKSYPAKSGRQLIKNPLIFYKKSGYHRRKEHTNVPF